MKKLFLTAVLIGFAYSSSVQAEQTNGFECMIQPSQTVEIRSAVVGVLKTTPVKKGSYIRKGQILATIDSSVEQSASNTARFRTQLKGNELAAQNKLNSINVKSQRMKQLADEKFVSMQAYDDAMNERNQAEAELRAVQENLQQSKFEYLQSQADLNRRVIKSPFDGMVTEQYLYVGSIVSPTDGKNPIFKIAKIDELSVKSIIPLRYFKKATIGQKVKIVPETPFSDSVIKSKLHIVDKVIDPSSGTFSAIAKVSNQNLSFPSGIRCKMYLE